MLLDENPFHILGASPRSGRQRIMALAEERGLFLDPGLCTRCGTDLITPRTRLEAEVAWVPGVSFERAEALVTAVQSGGAFETLASPLAQLNALVTQAVRRQGQPPEELTDQLLAIGAASERLDGEEVRALVNEDRRFAGFSLVEDARDVELALARHTDGIAALLARLLRGRPVEDWVAILSSALERQVDAAGAHGFRVLHAITDALAVDLEGKLREAKEKVDAGIERVRSAAGSKAPPALDGAVQYLSACLKRWARFARPLQLSARSRGQQHESSRDVAFAVRSAAIDIHNEHQAYDATLSLCGLLEQVFADDPRITEIVAADRKRIDELAEERKEFEAKTAILKDLQPITAAPTLRTVNGIGTVLAGRRDRDMHTGTYVATQYFAVFYIPLIPLAAYRVRDGAKGGWHFLGKVQLTPGQKRYRRVLGIAAAVALVIFVVTSESDGNSPSYSAGYTPSAAATSVTPAAPDPTEPSSPYAAPGTPAWTGLGSGSGTEDSRATLGHWIDAERVIINETEGELSGEQARLESLDATLDERKRVIESYEDAAPGGSLPPDSYDQYQTALQGYNSGVEEYNAALEEYKVRFAKYQATVAAFNDSVKKYNGWP